METKILLNVVKLYIVLPVFWALFDQKGSRWTLQAKQMSGDIGFMTIKPDQMQVLNPALILIFIPLYEVAFYPLLAKVGINKPLRKLTCGGILAGVSFVLSGIVELSLGEPNSLNILWQVPQYVVLTLGEVMFSVTGLQFSFTQAPESMKSVLMGCWNLTMAFGNLIVILITSIKIFDSQAYEFFLFAGLMFVDMAAFSLIAYRYKPIPLEMLNEVDESPDKLEKSELQFNAKDNLSFDKKE
jgi:POT family proton-dependent oligopeptide transporter